MKVPCYGCEERQVGCHSKCEKYIAYRKALDAKNEMIRREKDARKG